MWYKNSKNDFVMEYLQRYGYHKVAKKLQKVTNCRPPGKHKDPDQLASILVYEYLVENGYRKVANKLARIILDSSEKNLTVGVTKGTRKPKMIEKETNPRQTEKHNDPNQDPSIWVYDYLIKNGYQKVAFKMAYAILNNLKKDITETAVTKPTRKRKLSGCGKTETKVPKLADPDDIAFTLVSDYLNKHDYQAVAQELQNEVKHYSKLDLQGLDLPTVLKMSKSKLAKVPEEKAEAGQMLKLSESLSRKCDIPATKISKLKPVQVREKRKLCEPQTEIKVLKLSNPDQLDDLNQKVTINDLFIDKIDDLKILPQDSEISKVVKFILGSNFKVRKSMRNTVHYLDKFTCSQNYPYIRCDKLSSLRYGDASEESLILKQWDNLVEKVPIYVPEKFLLQIEKTTLPWCQLLIGAFLSQDLVENHRCAVQLFKALIGLKMRKGFFTLEEDDLILALVAKSALKVEWQNLAMELGRVPASLKARLHYLKHDKGKGIPQKRFTLEEDTKILEYVSEKFDISSPESIKSINRTHLLGLTNIIQRGQKIIIGRWNSTVMPTILAYLYGAPEIQWKEEFLKYVVEQKVMNLASMDWTCVLQKWPYQNKWNFTQVLNIASRNYRKKDTLGLPLYQQISAYLSHPVKKPTHNSLKERKRAILKAFDEIRFGKQ